MTRPEALAHVASYVAGLIQAADFEEATGLRKESVSDADLKRLGWAIEEVIRRLDRMGRQRA